MYNRDMRLVASDSGQMKLWEFIADKDEAPELKTVQQTQQMKISQIYANREGGEAWYHIVTSKDEFMVYDENLDLLSTGRLPPSDGG